MDYSNLHQRAQVAKTTPKGQSYPEGDFNAVFIGGSYGLSRNGNEMVTFEGKLKAPDRQDVHDRKFKIRYVLTVDFRVNELLCNLLDWGVDLERLKSKTDWNLILDELEEERARFVVSIKPQKNDPKFSEFTIKSVTPIRQATGGVPVAPASLRKPVAKSETETGNVL
jgi:hypothetical protein